MTGRNFDESLEVLGSAEVPPQGDELRRELDRLAPAKPRRPRRQWAVLVTVSAAYAASLVALTGLRRDLEALPLSWLVVYSAAWLGAFAAAGYLAIVPGRGDALPRWRGCTAMAVLACLGFTAAGLLVARHAPGLSTVYEPTPASVLERAPYCLELGLLTAVVPIALAVLLLRRATPIGSRRVAAAIGAAGGALGGLVLQLHCPIAERFHMGLVHGGVVLLAALAAAALAPRWTRP